MPYDQSTDPNRYQPYSPIAPSSDLIPVTSGASYDAGTMALQIYVPSSVSVVTVNVVGANTGGVSRALKYGPGNHTLMMRTISATWSDGSVEIHRHV